MEIRENMAHYRRTASVGAATFLVLLLLLPSKSLVKSCPRWIPRSPPISA